MEQDLTTTLSSCVLFMGLVAWISYRKSRGDTQTRDGYFLANRGLGAPIIAGSLLLTNLSAEQLIGLNGSAYGFNMSSMAWEVTAAFATVVMAFVFLPRYLAMAFTTLPEFLSRRFDHGVRRMTVVLFILGYGLVTIPSVLYSGSLAVMKLFAVPDLLGIDSGTALTLTVVVIGMTGALYAVFGGLKAVAVSDTINGLGLLIVGIAIPLLGLAALGEGSVLQGLTIVTREETHKLNAIGSSSDPTPFATLFTGMVFANLFYWCANQYVIQRTLAARSLAEGQKGVLLSGFFKVLVPFLMMLPGVIAYHLYGPDLAPIDLAYPQLVRDVLPGYAWGFFLAVLLGAVFSSFNSLLNSAATLFCLDVYQPLRGGAVDDRSLVQTAKWVSAGIALFSFLVAPLLQYASEGLWQLIRIFTGFYNIPVIAIVMVGLFTRKVPPLAAKTVIVMHVVVYGLLQFVFKEQMPLHFLHLYAIMFVVEVGVMLLMGRYRPMPPVAVPTPSERIDLAPWPYAIPCAVSLLSSVVVLYLLFSPIGLVDGGTGWLLPSVLLLVAACAGCWWWQFRVLRLASTLDAP